MENFLSLPEADRRAVFVQTAAKMGRIDPSAVEKDFWICLFLKRLFESPLGGRLVFKGGTTLARLASRSGIRVRARDMVREREWNKSRTSTRSNPRKHMVFAGVSSILSTFRIPQNSNRGPRKKAPSVRLSTEGAERTKPSGRA